MGERVGGVVEGVESKKIVEIVKSADSFETVNRTVTIVVDISFFSIKLRLTKN